MKSVEINETDEQKDKEVWDAERQQIQRYGKKLRKKKTGSRKRNRHRGHGL